jgi:hypothetical protein
LAYEQALSGELQEKVAFFVSSIVHASFNNSFKSSLPKMQSERIKKLTSLQMDSNNMLHLQLNDLLSQLIPAGITNYLESYSGWFLNRPVDDEIVDPRRILSLSDLEYGFTLWLVACFVAILCFVGELLIFLVKNFIILVEFSRVLKSRLNHYHDTW